MSTIFEPTPTLAQFKLPPQDIDVLSFCGSNKVSKVKEWMDDLKITQVNQTTVALYSALPEVAHLKTDVGTRFAMLELFWPAVQRCLEVFSKEFLQQPLILPPRAQKAAIISQALQKHLLDGYTICAKELITRKKLKGQKQDILIASLYRAMTALSRFVLRSYQLYTPLPPQMWLRAHTLLQIAEFYELQNVVASVSQEQGSAGASLLQRYLQLTAMASIQPSKMSQNDLSITYSALDSWAKHIKLFPAAAQDDHNPYVINLSKDEGPQEKVRFNAADSDHVFELDFQSIAKQMEKDTRDNETIDNHISQRSTFIPAQMPSTLVEHILNCWSQSAERKQSRKNILIRAEACIGIIDCHYHLSGKVDFNSFIDSEPEGDKDSFLSSDFDQLITNLSQNEDSSTPQTEKETIFDVSIQNVSSGGYCLQWADKLPSRIEAGELISIRETGRRAWSIGIVRWIKQGKSTSQMGIQILCNQPVPYGASVTLENGLVSDYMRVIHIPSPTMDDQAPSILTTTIPFQEGCRAELKQDDHITPIRLGKAIFSTSKMKLFAFDTLSKGDD